jgi:peroxiredoxin
MKTKFMSNMRLIKLSVFVLLIVLSVNVFSQQKKNSINDLLDKELPYFKGLLLSGDSISSSNLKGKVTLIQFLYLGCVPCMHEVPYYNDLYKSLDKNRFDLVAICPETFNTLKKFNDNDSTSPAHVLHKAFKIERIAYKVLAECKEQSYPFGRPQCSTISEKFYLSGYPFSVLVDKSGIIRKIYGGFTMDETEAKKLIEELKVDIIKLME